MNRLRRKLAVNGMVTILSVIFIFSMIAAPAVAYVTANQVVSSSIKDGEVKTKDLAVGAVGTGRIKNGAVTGAKIKDYSITKYDIHSGSINKYKLTSNAVNSVKILDGSILARDIANGAVNSAKIANGSILGSDIADGTITNVDIAAGAAIAASKINTAGLNADSVDGKHASAFATSGHNHDTAYSALAHNHDTDYYKKAIADAAFAAIGHNHDSDYLGVSHSHDSSYSVLGHNHDAAYVNDNAGEVDSADIANDSIDSAKIQNSSITGTDIAPNTISDSDIASDAAIQDSKIGYSAKTSYYSVGSRDFVPGTSTNALNSGTYYAPVHLPHGATVTELGAYVFDSDFTVGHYVRAELYRGSVSTSALMAETSESVSLGYRWITDSSIDDSVINNTGYTYYIKSQIGTNTAQYVARVTYTFDEPGY